MECGFQHTEHSLFQESGSKFLLFEEFLQHHWNLFFFKQAGSRSVMYLMPFGDNPPTVRDRD